MDIVLYQNSSDDNVINKTLSLVDTLSGHLKTPFDITRPIVNISHTGILNANYCYIAEFSRYYYIENQTIVSEHLVMLTLRVDVLKSFSMNILNLRAIVDNETNGDKYLTDNGIFLSTVKTATDVINFPGGLNDDGAFILITAGG